jgi:hypothetical protein
MRQIKFRAWDKDNKIMHQPCSMVSNWNPETMSYEAITPNYIYMQYTALKDRNGKEVYLGDIIFDEDGEYSKTVEICQAEEPDPIGFFAKDIHTDESYALCEVDGIILGNIYENTKLKKD